MIGSPRLLSLRRLLQTLADIGPRRLQRRIRYELRQRLDSQLPAPLVKAWAGCNTPAPAWRPMLGELASAQVLAAPQSLQPPASIRFNFLNQERWLSWPIVWNDPGWPRLWQFHLHYFDWAREWLDQAIASGEWPAEAWALEPLLDQWIAANPMGRGDGWHSYTLSLRCRNWIWLFRCCPALATPARLHSLWQQLCWLHSHPEHANGGNHWLENLLAVALAALQFDGDQAKTMHCRALVLLQRELASQVLADGGHEERSASYHLLMLDRLVELACVLAADSSGCPAWLEHAIEAMLAWSQAIRLGEGRAPRYNDSAEDAAPPLDEVVSFAEAALSLGSWPQSALRRRLLQAAQPHAPQLSQGNVRAGHRSPPSVTDLPQTGWTLLRPGHGWELSFKCGVPCPNHLPGHVHSDQLSLELSRRGRWILSEAGTSVYGNGPDRAYERSGAAHNVLQLGLPAKDGSIHWLEPVDVWGGFRAGRKARPRDRQQGGLPSGGLFAEGSHDGFDHLGAWHHRRIELPCANATMIDLSVLDTIKISRFMLFRIWWHLAPGYGGELLQDLDLHAPSVGERHADWHTTWFATGFGQRQARQSYCVAGSLSSGIHRLRTKLMINQGD